MLEYFFSLTLFQLTWLTDKYFELKLPVGKVEILKIHSFTSPYQLVYKLKGCWVEAQMTAEFNYISLYRASHRGPLLCTYMSNKINSKSVDCLNWLKFVTRPAWTIYCKKKCEICFTNLKKGNWKSWSSLVYTLLIKSKPV